jgi:hypothetical protein
LQLQEAVGLLHRLGWWKGMSGGRKPDSVLFLEFKMVLPVRQKFRVVFGDLFQAFFLQSLQNKNSQIETAKFNLLSPFSCMNVDMMGSMLRAPVIEQF